MATTVIPEIEIRTTPVQDGEVLPMQTREFQVTEFKKLPKKARRLKADKVAANIERRKRKPTPATQPDRMTIPRKRKRTTRGRGRRRGSVRDLDLERVPG